MNRDVRLRIETALPERLITRALEDGAVFAEIHCEGHRILMVDLDPGSAEILKQLCAKFGCDLRELRRCGRTALREQLRRRWTLLLGLMLGMAICAWVLSRVWIVEVQCTGGQIDSSVQEQILACLEENRIRAGIPRSRVDADLLQKELIAHAQNAGHIGVKLQGIRLLTELVPVSDEPELYEIDAPRDLVARCSGVIEQIHVYSGRANVCIGDTVQRGDVLVRGEENIAKDLESGEMITRPVGARAEVIARCWYEGSARGSLSSTVQQRTGRKSLSGGIRLMKFQLPILEGETYAASETDEQTLPIGGLFLPLELVRTTHYETRTIDLAIDRKALEARLITLARADALRKMEAAGEYEIASEWIDLQIHDNTMHIRAVYEIYTDIASDRDALIEEVY